MKIKDCFVLQQIHDEYLVVPIGEEMDRLNGVIKLSETGAFLWELLSKGVGSEDDLISAVMAEYEIARRQVQDDVKAFMDQLSAMGCLEA